MIKFERLIGDPEYEGWPVIFYVCEKHKLLFADYENARVSAVKPCTLCHPVKNDSLGG